MLTIVEKVILLQDVDIFEHTSTEHLAQIAAIADEVRFDAEESIYEEGAVPDSMYILIDGRVQLMQNNQVIKVVEQNEAFGTWALFDEKLRVASAQALTESSLLRVDREDFMDLLADNILITQEILRAFAKRLRGLYERITPRNRSQK